MLNCHLLPFTFHRSTESDVIIKHKVKLILQKVQNMKVCLLI